MVIPFTNLFLEPMRETVEKWAESEEMVRKRVRKTKSAVSGVPLGPVLFSHPLSGQVLTFEKRLKHPRRLTMQ